MKAKGYIILTFRFTKEGDNWVGICEQLGTSAFDKSIEIASEKLRELTGLHLNTLEQIGERERVFRENGIKVFAQKPSNDKTVNCPIDPNALISHQVQTVSLAN